VRQELDKYQVLKHDIGQLTICIRYPRMI